MMSRRRLLPLSLLAVLGLVFAACGDDDDSATETDDATDIEDTEDSEDTDEDDDEAAFSGDVGECGFFAEFATAFGDVDPTELLGAGEEIDFGSFFGPLAEEFQKVADAAPSEIEDAFRTVADGFSDVADQLDGVVIDLSDPENIDPEAIAALESMDTSFTGEFEDASDEIDAWMQEHCADFADAIDLDSFGS